MKHSQQFNINNQKKPFNWTEFTNPLTSIERMSFPVLRSHTSSDGVNMQCIYKGKLRSDNIIYEIDEILFESDIINIINESERKWECVCVWMESKKRTDGVVIRSTQ
jgi:hypothetical protein